MGPLRTVHFPFSHRGGGGDGQLEPNEPAPHVAQSIAAAWFNVKTTGVPCELGTDTVPQAISQSLTRSTTVQSEATLQGSD
jgi:hypothetical protein